MRSYKPTHLKGLKGSLILVKEPVVGYKCSMEKKEWEKWDCITTIGWLPAEVISINSICLFVAFDTAQGNAFLREFLSLGHIFEENKKPGWIDLLYFDQVLRIFFVGNQWKELFALIRI